MSEHKATSFLPDPLERPNFSQFSENCHIEQEGNVTMIYDPSDTRRWYVFRYTDHEKIDRLRLSLQGQTGLVWHTLMGINQAKNATTGQELSSWLEIDVVEDDASLLKEEAGSRMYFYDTAKESLRIEGWGGGYWKPKDDVIENLREHYPAAVIKSDLPKSIDVKLTGTQLINRFNEGRFDPPAFVIPAKPLIASTTRRVTSFIKRLSGREGAAVKKIDFPSIE